jgi:tripartite-type tricarboxylate transporter receptor subunit TctC
MLLTQSRIGFCLVACALSLAGHGVVSAQSYPAKPVRLVVPFAPGGGSDLVGRVLAQKLSASLRQQFVPDNRAGAGGRIGTELVAKSPPDGYTLLFATSSVMVIAPAVYSSLPFDMPSDFTPISQVASTAYVLIAHPTVPARTVKELIALAKSRPGKLTYASSGTGALSHLSGELFTTLAGIKMVHVPYKGSSPGTFSVASGETDTMFSNLLPALPLVKGGRLHALGVTSTKRSSLLPDVPPIRDSMPGFVVEQLYGLLGPAKLPADIVKTLNAETAKAVQAPDTKEKLLADGSEVAVSTPEELEKRIRSEIAQWAKIIKGAGVRAE